MKMSAEKGFVIRHAEKRDLAGMLEIYNREVLCGTATFDLDPKTPDEWSLWFGSHDPAKGHPVLVADCGGAVAGYASLSPFRDKQAYAATAELSVYVAEGFRSRGAATLLIKAVADEARRAGVIHNIVSVITDGNGPSERLHDRLGFSRCGALPEVGEKFGKKLGVVFYSLIL